MTDKNAAALAALQNWKDDKYGTPNEILSDHFHTLVAALTPSPAVDVSPLKDALRDVLKAICSDRHAVQDTLFVNGTPVGDFISCALDEDIDYDALQNAPYRCKKTLELPLPAQSDGVEEVTEGEALNRFGEAGYFPSNVYLLFHAIKTVFPHGLRIKQAPKGEKA